MTATAMAWSEDEVLGYADDAACNYSADATDDDGSCNYPIDIYGIDYVDYEGAVE